MIAVAEHSEAGTEIVLELQPQACPPAAEQAELSHVRHEILWAVVLISCGLLLTFWLMNQMCCSS